MVGTDGTSRVTGVMCDLLKEQCRFRGVSVWTLVKMKGAELACLLLICVPQLVLGTHDVYIVTMEGDPVVSYSGGVEGFPATATDLDEEMDITSEAVTSYSLHLRRHHDTILDSLFVAGTYEKLYSYHHLINGFAVHMSSLQAEFLRKAPGVKHVERDMRLQKLTTHTPEFLGLLTGVWPTGGGFDRAGEDVVIGFVDSGIYPQHPSFVPAKLILMDLFLIIKGNARWIQ